MSVTSSWVTSFSIPSPSLPSDVPTEVIAAGDHPTAPESIVESSSWVVIPSPTSSPANNPVASIDSSSWETTSSIVSQIPSNVHPTTRAPNAPPRFTPIRRYIPAEVISAINQIVVRGGFAPRPIPALPEGATVMYKSGRSDGNRSLICAGDLEFFDTLDGHLFMEARGRRTGAIPLEFRERDNVRMEREKRERLEREKKEREKNDPGEVEEEKKSDPIPCSRIKTPRLSFDEIVIKDKEEWEAGREVRDAVSAKQWKGVKGGVKMTRMKGSRGKKRTDVPVVSRAVGDLIYRNKHLLAALMLRKRQVNLAVGKHLKKLAEEKANAVAEEVEDEREEPLMFGELEIELALHEESVIQMSEIRVSAFLDSVQNSELAGPLSRGSSLETIWEEEEEDLLENVWEEEEPTPDLTSSTSTSTSTVDIDPVPTTPAAGARRPILARRRKVRIAVSRR